jgi:5-aminolevulinate synthase
MDYEAFFNGHLGRLRDEGRYRVFAELERIVGAFPRARLHREGQDPCDVTVWCSNDYLAMGQHPAVVEAMQAAIGAQGSGAGGTRNISGTNTLHAALERELAALHGKEAALVFTSGYVANETTLQTLGAMLPGCELYSDAFNHASMIAGIRQGVKDLVIAPVFCGTAATGIGSYSLPISAGSTARFGSPMVGLSTVFPK